MLVENGQYAISDEGDVFLMSESSFPPEEEVDYETALAVPRRKTDPSQKVFLVVMVGQLSFNHLCNDGTIPNDLITLYLEDFFRENDFQPSEVTVKDEYTFMCTLIRLDGTSFTRKEIKLLHRGLKDHSKNRYNFRLVEQREQEALIYEG